MNTKSFKAKKPWIVWGLIGITVGSLLLSLFGLTVLPHAFLILSAGLLLGFVHLSVWILGPKRIYLGKITVDDQGFTMKTCREEKTIKWEEVQSLGEEKTTARLGGITFYSPWYWGPNELYTIENRKGEKVGFSSETENYEELLEIVVSKADLHLVDTSFVHGGRTWLKVGEKYERRPKKWFNSFAVVVILFFVFLGIYICWLALNPQA